MDNKRLEELIIQLENYLECWKQFNHYLSLARTKKFGPEDENQFLEVKSVLTQELEMVISSLEFSNPSKEDVHNLLGSGTSLRFLSETNEGAFRALENQWHKIYIGLQSILGQLKVQQRQAEPKPSVWSNFFGKKKS
jgi:hypothetical protein